jgi:predicted nucleic-acid-binding Zn-ribbon protein
MSADPPTCPDCGGTLYEVDEIVSGFNGALSDVGTGRIVLVCEDCGEVPA